MLGFLILLVAATSLKQKLDPQLRAIKQHAAMSAAQAAGIASVMQNLAPSGSGFVFTVAAKDRERLDGVTMGPGWLSGELYLLHSRECDCREFGQCRDYRSRNGVYGPGSLQVVLNRTTGQGYFDYDKWNPYESWRQFAKHAEEI